VNDRTEPSAAELRQLLAVVLEALDIPSPATIGDGEVYDRILLDRVLDARVALGGVLRRGDDPGWSADYLRARLAEKPATGYRAAGSAEQLHDDQADEAERARRSVDAQFPVVAEFLAKERADEVARWNAARPVGIAVTAYPGVRGENGLTTRTRSEAWLLGGHTPMVKVDGYAGGIALTHVDVAAGTEQGEGEQ